MNDDEISCDKPVSVKEVAEAISLWKNNKSPGTDGITAEFYKTFSLEICVFI